MQRSFLCAVKITPFVSNRSNLWVDIEYDKYQQVRKKFPCVPLLSREIFGAVERAEPLREKKVLLID